jgi:PAS domain S-box-containing protein
MSHNNIDFDALFSYATMGIIIADGQGRVLMANPFLLKQFGYEERDIIGQKIERLIPPRFHKQHIQYREKFIEYPRNRPMGIGQDLYAVRKDGSEFPVEVSLGTYKTPQGQFSIAFLSDVSSRKEAEMALKQLNIDLEKKVEERTQALTTIVKRLGVQIKDAEAKDIELQRVNSSLNVALEKEKELNELKSGFVSLASHEFRTPLSTILSSAYLVSKYAQTAEQPQRERHIMRIVSAVNMLTDILNDFLSVGKIEEGKIQEHKVIFDVEEHINTIISEMHGLQKKRQNLQYNHTGNTTILMDPGHLKHIVMNLLSNAIKFSPQGSNIILQTTATEKTFTLSILDNGIGIPEEDQLHLFERFYRGKNASNIQGTGLGLHIVQQYVELMNGKISCQSKLDKGTEFTVMINL